MKLILGECLEEMAKLPAASVDLVVTSPPYDGLRTYNGYSFDFEPIARQLFRIVKPGRVVVWVVGDATINGSETGTSFRQALYFKEIGFNLHDTMIYEKTNYMPSETSKRKRYMQAFEYMFVFSRERVNAFNLITVPKTTEMQPGKFRYADGTLKPANSPASLSKDKAAPNIWRYGVGQASHGHPATFPEALARDHILSWSNPGDTVFDPFLGSGTTGKVAILNNREFIGIEVSAEYFEIAERRISEAVFGKMLDAANP